MYKLQIYSIFVIKLDLGQKLNVFFRKLKQLKAKSLSRKRTHLRAQRSAIGGIFVWGGGGVELHRFEYPDMHF